MVFCAYSALLLFQAFHDREQLREAAERRLVADSQRRASALADFAGDRFHLSEHMVALNELNTYLASKALGMSPLYGLNASLDALERRFRDRTAAVNSVSRTTHELPFSRIVFYDETGQVLADSGGTTELPPSAGRPDAGIREPSIELSPQRRELVVIVPVMFKDQFSGTLVTLTDVGEFYRSMIQLGAGDAYRETLLTLEGQEIVAPNSPAVFEPVLARVLATLPESRPVPLADVKGAGSLNKSVAIVTAVPGVPLRLVTTQPRDVLDGSLTSPAFLYSLGVFPALLLLLAFRFDRLRHRTDVLEQDASRAMVQQRSLEDRNEALSVEIRRREAVEAELQGHRDHLEELVAQRTNELARLFHALPVCTSGSSATARFSSATPDVPKTCWCRWVRCWASACKTSFRQTWEPSCATRSAASRAAPIRSSSTTSLRSNMAPSTSKRACCRWPTIRPSWWCAMRPPVTRSRPCASATGSTPNVWRAPRASS